MNRVLLAQAPPQRWRNGGGTTRQLLAWPQADDWQLRVSVAAIEQDGDFSAFPGVERWFAAIAGPGVVLALPGGRATLHAGSAPVCFDGEDAPLCRLTAGPTQDLNLMVRRGAGSGRMQRATAGSRVEGALPWRGLYAADALTLAVDGVDHAVAAGSLVWSDAYLASVWQLRGQAAAPCAWWLNLEPT